MGLILAITVGCTQVKEPEFKGIKEFGVKNIDFEKATIGFSVTYYNPNNFNVNVKEAVADVYIDSIYMGSFTQEVVVNVQKNKEFSIPFLGEVPLKKVLQLNLQELKNKNILLQANGSVKVGKAGIYITKPIEYSGRHKLDEVRP